MTSDSPEEDSNDSLAQLKRQLRVFAKERDWDQFHSPKNLAMALAVEAGELLEPFQWLTEEESRTLDSKGLAAVREELADVLLYLVRLADKVNVDLAATAADKMTRNAEKYPIDKAKGSSRKYTAL